MTISKIHQVGILTALAVLLPSAVNAFEAGRSSLAISAGSGNYFNESYLSLGVGYDYFLLDGLQIGLKTDVWLDGDRNIYQLTPGVKYILPVSRQFKPYVGVFYRRNFIEGEDDIDASGYRAGVYYTTGERSYIAYGISYSKLKDCDEAIYIDCDVTSSELSFVNSF